MLRNKEQKPLKCLPMSQSLHFLEDQQYLLTVNYLFYHVVYGVQANKMIQNAVPTYSERIILQNHHFQF
jgi:hypothetical protein